MSVVAGEGAAIFRLGLQQLLASRRSWILLLLVGLPLLAAGLFHLAEESNAREFADDLTNQMLVSVILPLAMLVMAAATFGNELEDKTLGYLTLKPVARWKIVLAKFLATLLVGGVPVALSGLVATLIVVNDDAAGAAAVGLGLLLGAAAYGAGFVLAGLLTRHALPIGVVYVFIWEAALASVLDGVRFVSVRQYTLGFIHGIDEVQLSTLDIELGIVAGLIGLTVVPVVYLGLAVRRLGRMDIP